MVAIEGVRAGVGIQRERERERERGREKLCERGRNVGGMVRGLSKAVRAAAKAAHGGEQKEERTWRDETALGPRSFPYHVKEACWAKAEPVKGRDPARWRRDALGNIVFRKLVGCQGCLCHDYDHIVPYSKVLSSFVSRFAISVELSFCVSLCLSVED